MLKIGFKKTALPVFGAGECCLANLELMDISFNTKFHCHG